MCRVFRNSWFHEKRDRVRSPAKFTSPPRLAPCAHYWNPGSFGQSGAERANCRESWFFRAAITFSHAPSQLFQPALFQFEPDHDRWNRPRQIFKPPSFSPKPLAHRRRGWWESVNRRLEAQPGPSSEYHAPPCLQWRGQQWSALIRVVWSWG